MSIDLETAPASVLQSAIDHPAPRRAFVDAHPGLAGALAASWHVVRPHAGGHPRYALIEANQA